MATRNILDSNGNIIGQLTLPDSTTEQQWQETLSLYTQIPQAITDRTLIDSYTVTANDPVTTSSSQEAVIGGMSLIPKPGKYIAIYNGSIYTAGASAVGEFGIYINDILKSETRRDISCNLQLLGGLVTISVNAIGIGTYTGTEIVLDGTQRVEAKFKSTNGGTIGFKERVLTLIKVR